MGKVVTIEVQEQDVSVYESGMVREDIVKRLCAPHFAEGDSVRFVSPSGKPLLDVSAEHGWLVPE